MVSNLTLCCYHQADYVQAVAYASKGLEHNPDSAKLLLRRARALSMKVRGCVAGVRCLGGGGVQAGLQLLLCQVTVLLAR